MRPPIATRRGLTRPGPRRPRPGYTLVEVLVVVAIIAIAGAIVVPSMVGAGSLQIQAAGRMVIADLLYAQNEAIAQQSPRRVVFDPANNRYVLTDADGLPLPASWRSGGSGTNDYAVDFNRDGRFSGVKITSAAFGEETVIEFDALGAPSQGGTIELAASNARYRIAVAPFTGRVTIAPVAGGE